MNLSERISIVLKENHLKQKDLAKEIGVTESYISAIMNGRNAAISMTLATLIEEKYGYKKPHLIRYPQKGYPADRTTVTRAD